MLSNLNKHVHKRITVPIALLWLTVTDTKVDNETYTDPGSDWVTCAGNRQWTLQGMSE